jgi:hypothetical protein
MITFYRRGVDYPVLLDEIDEIHISNILAKPGLNGRARRLTSTGSTEPGKKIYAVIIVNGVRYYLHRYLMGLLNGMGGEVVVDHINGNTLDNRRSNLRIVPAIVNSLNKRKGTGVSYDKAKKLWRAEVTCHDQKYRVRAHFKDKGAALEFCTKQRENLIVEKLKEFYVE